MSKIVDGIKYSNDMKTVVGVENKDITRAVIAEGVTTIGQLAFNGCSSLESLVIPSSVTEIRQYAFLVCTALKTLKLGDNFEKISFKWFEYLPDDFEIICTEGSKTYKVIKRSSKLKAHIKSLALEDAKDEKIKQIQQVSIDSFLKTYLKDVAESSFEILSNTKTSTVILVHVGANNVVFKLGTNWMQKLQNVLQVLTDQTKSGTEIFNDMIEQKISITEIPLKKAENIILSTDSNGKLRFFSKGELKNFIPKNVKKIELFGMTKIGDRAFKECRLLESVEIPESVMEISDYAFCECDSLKFVDIPSSVTKIGEGAFKGCNIKELEHPCLSIKNGMAIKDGIVLYCASRASEIAIPEGITEISNYAFYGISSLKSLDIPSSVKKIGTRAFNDCSSLESVVISESVMEIGENAFENCSSLSSVKYGGSVVQWNIQLCGFRRKVSKKALVECNDGIAKAIDENIEEYTIPEGVSVIGDDAFASFNSLKSVVIPEGVRKISWGAFRVCRSLESLSISSSITEIGDYAFNYCSSLASIEFKGTKEKWAKIKKGKDWMEKSAVKSVKCSDGEEKLF